MSTARVILALAPLALAACAGNGETTLQPTETPPTSPTVEDIPAGYIECENEVDGYVVAYPEDWYTASTTPETECRWFDREPLELDEGSEPPPLDLEVVAETRSFDEVVDQIRSGETDEELDSETDTTVGSWEAFRFEATATGDGQFESGTRRYGYVVDVDGRAFIVMTMLIPGGEEPYEENKTVVDEVAGTLRLLNDD